MSVAFAYFLKSLQRLTVFISLEIFLSVLFYNYLKPL